MAVYTRLSFDEIAILIEPLQLGRLVATEEVSAGVENSTYFLSLVHPAGATEQFVLTIAETLSTEAIHFVADMLQLLHRHGLPVPAPMRGASGHGLEAKGKPALLIPRARGAHPHQPTIAQCKTIGAALARLHRVTLDAGLSHRSHRSLDWVLETGHRLLQLPDLPDAALLSTELIALEKLVSANNLIEGVIHGDLFRDNTLFEGDRLTAIIDFFSAGTGPLLMDLAIVANDWCRATNGLDRMMSDQLLYSYCSVRNPAPGETRLWGDLLRIGALRFWVSRLAERWLPDPHLPASRGKDPDEYRDLLLHHRQHPCSWPH